MSSKKIDEATTVATVAGTENVPVSASGEAKKMSVTQIKDYVLGQLGGIANVDTAAISTDGVYLKRDSTVKPIAANTLADAIIAFAFGKDEIETLTTEATIVIKSGDDIKTTDINELAEVIEDALNLDVMNIMGLDAKTVNTLSDYNLIAVDDEDLQNRTCHVTLYTLATYIGTELSRMFSTTSTALTDDNYLLACTGSDSSLECKKIKVSASGLGRGNVTGPATNTDGNIPQWNGKDSKALKNGLSVTSSVSASSSSTEIPTAAAVHTAISNITVSGDVTGPATSTNGALAAFDGTTGKAIKNGPSVSTEITTTPSTVNVPTEKAVSDCIDSKIEAECETDGTISDTIYDIVNSVSLMGVKTDSVASQWDMSHPRIGYCTANSDSANKAKLLRPKFWIETTTGNTCDTTGCISGDSTTDDQTFATKKKVQSMIDSRTVPHAASDSLPTTTNRLMVVEKTVSDVTSYYLATRFTDADGNTKWYGVKMSDLDTI